MIIWKGRKLFKKYIYFLIILMCIFIIMLHLFSEPPEYRNNKYKIGLIEELMKSNENLAECTIPNLPINNPEIMKFYKEDHELKCGNPNNDWIECHGSICSIKEIIFIRKGHVTCTYTELIRKNDYQIRYGKSMKTKDPYILKESDFAKANCKAQNGDRWIGLVIGIREKINRKLTKQSHYNVLMFGFDSLSRNAFIRKLPKTYDYFIQNLGGVVLNGYNIVGDGTPQALIPILTGHNELELPETRKRITNSGYVNLYPMIWKNYETNGYVTSFNEDLPTYGTFTYRLNGFDVQPTDHYMRTFYVEVQNYINSYANQYCIGNIPGYRVMMEYTKNFMQKYLDIPRFIFSFHGDLSHDSINLIGAADNDVYNWLVDLKESKLLENTILILMSDHGNRFADVRNTLQGKQEERLPFFSFMFPETFQQNFPIEYANFLQNTKRLTTPYDIHETLLDILRLQNLQIPSSVIQQNEHQLKNPPRAISLLQSIPKNRSCANAYIEPHWCSCLNWVNLNDTTSMFAKDIATSVISTINNYIHNYHSICESLLLDEIHWLMKLKPHDDLIRFKQNKDIDGYLADLSSKMLINNELYQIKFTVQPGHSIFEASATHYITNNKFDVKISEISRINKYGKQANCIYDINPELRKFCYCK